jgi:hypothetical protein
MAKMHTSSLTLLLLAAVLLAGAARANGVANSTLGNDQVPTWDLTDAIDGCALCRGGDCTRAINNASAGIFCGELQTTRQPCCCEYVTTCAVDQFYDACRCKQPDQLERMLVDFWVWCLLGLVAAAFFPFAVLLELVVRLLAVVGLHCHRLRGALAHGGKVCQSGARQPVAPAYAAIVADEPRADTVADDQDKPDAEMC